jgi:hypothetical protein
MSVAEIILQDSPRQYEELCRFLYHILEVSKKTLHNKIEYSPQGNANILPF